MDVRRFVFEVMGEFKCFKHFFHRIANNVLGPPYFRAFQASKTYKVFINVESCNHTRHRQTQIVLHFFYNSSYLMPCTS